MTSLEKQVAESLSRIGFQVGELGPANTWVSQYKVGRYRVDFALPDAEIALEVDGDHWHGVGLINSRQLAQKEKDREKHNTLARKGWSVIRLREKLIGSPNFDELLNKMILGAIET